VETAAVGCWADQYWPTADTERLLMDNIFLRTEIADLNGQLHDQAGSIPADILRRLILLSHPDKHANSVAANEVAAWLLAQRRIKAA